MSQPRGFGLNGSKLYTNICNPKEVWCNFIVDSTNGNGWGVRSVKSNGYIEAVFMHTSATPGKQNALLNPNPQAGYAVVRFKNTFNYYLGGFSGQIVPLTSTSTTSLTAGNVYVITSVGTTTLAQWQTLGLIPGVQPVSNTGISVATPTVGMTFVAASSGSIPGTGTVGLPGVPSATTLTVVGDPNQTIANNSVTANAGAQVVVQFAAPTNSTTTTLTPTSPANGTVVSMQFAFDGSSVTIDGL
jgi:hypothetical protein